MSGRGIGMVAELSERWGVQPTSTGKAVWCEIALLDDRPARGGS